MRERGAALIAVGKVGAPHGVRGHVRLKSYTGDPLAIGSYGALTLADGRKLTISQVRHLKDDMVVASFAGMDGREAVEALVGQEMFVARAALPPPNLDEFYHADLIGLDARLESGQILGRVASIHNFGAGDILEIAVAGGETLLLPFTKAIVPVLDFTLGCLTVILPGEIEVPGEFGTF